MSQEKVHGRLLKEEAKYLSRLGSRVGRGTLPQNRTEHGSGRQFKYGIPLDEFGAIEQLPLSINFRILLTQVYKAISDGKLPFNPLRYSLDDAIIRNVQIATFNTMRAKYVLPEMEQLCLAGWVDLIHEEATRRNCSVYEVLDGSAQSFQVLTGNYEGVKHIARLQTKFNLSQNESIMFFGATITESMHDLMILLVQNNQRIPSFPSSQGASKALHNICRGYLAQRRRKIIPKECNYSNQTDQVKVYHDRPANYGHSDYRLVQDNPFYKWFLAYQDQLIVGADVKLWKRFQKSCLAVDENLLEIKA